MFASPDRQRPFATTSCTGATAASARCSIVRWCFSRRCPRDAASLEAGRISRDQLVAAIDSQRRHGGTLGAGLIRIGAIDEEQLTEFLRQRFGVRRVGMDELGAIEQPVLKNAINTDELAVLAVSEELLHLPWAVKRTMPAPLRESVQSTLVDLEKSEAGKQVLRTAVLTGIGKAEDKDYDPHRRMVRAVFGSLEGTATR